MASAFKKSQSLSLIHILAIAAFPIVWFVLGEEHYKIYFSILSGLLAGVLIGLATEYFTSDSCKPTKKLASQSETGSATIIIGGIGLGMLSTCLLYTSGSGGSKGS